jgi:hydroxymethylpyrimidine/phosphomethylpyrimidine kinase
MNVTPPRVLAIAGSDSGGGAGIQADLKTMLALGVHGMTVVTAVTAQNSVGVQGYWELPTQAVRAQLDSVLGDIGAQAIKTGMLASAEVVSTVCASLAGVAAPIVVDPVAVSKHGDSLISAGALEAIKAELLPLTTVVTPNLLEANLLTGMTITDEADMLEAAQRIATFGPRWVLVKGGHLPGNPVDLLYGAWDGGGVWDGDGTWEEGGVRASGSPRDGDPLDGGGAGARGAVARAAGLGASSVVVRYPGRRIDSKHTHGTGCTLASAIASYLALGADVPRAVESAKEYVTGAIDGGFPLGAGIGPVDHGWRIRQPVSG